MKERTIFAIFGLIGGLCLILSIILFGFNIVYPFKYKNLIVKYCDEYALEYSLVASIIYSESRYKNDAVSSKGAIGLMQIMPTTAKSFYGGDDFELSLLYDPGINIEIGTKYLSYLFNKYNDETTVLACYNAGEGTVRKWMGENLCLEKTQIRYHETLNYVNKVQRTKKIYAYRF